MSAAPRRKRRLRPNSETLAGGTTLAENFPKRPNSGTLAGSQNSVGRLSRIPQSPTFQTRTPWRVQNSGGELSQTSKLWHSGGKPKLCRETFQNSKLWRPWRKTFPNFKTLALWREAKTLPGDFPELQTLAPLSAAPRGKRRPRPGPCRPRRAASGALGLALSRGRPRRQFRKLANSGTLAGSQNSVGGLFQTTVS